MEDNFVGPGTRGYIVRLGYRGFLSAVWMLWKMNSNAKQLGIKSRCEIMLPIRWLR